MRNYLYMAEERINSIYNQLVSSTPIEEIKETLDKTGVFTDWKSRLGAGFVSLVKGEVGYSREKIMERSFKEGIRSRLELEQKITYIEERIRFVNIEVLIIQKAPLFGGAVCFSGAYYSKGLRAPNHYTSENWDGVLPFLYRRIEGVNIKIVYSPLHFISQTPWAIVHGRLRLDGIGFVATWYDKDVLITPIAFGLPVSELSSQLLSE